MVEDQVNDLFHEADALPVRMVCRVKEN